jgi:circadian clock protein KaiB
MSTVRLRLYVTGRTARSEAALDDLRTLVDAHLAADTSIEVIDVLEEPEVAAERHILATPTLDKVTPMPSRRIVGDLSDVDAVLDALDLSPRRAGTTGA